MPQKTYEFKDTFDDTVRDLNKLLMPVLDKSGDEFRSDVHLMSLLIGTLLGMLGSYTVNNIPTVKEVKGGFNRRQLQQIEDAIRTNAFRVDFESEKREMIQKVEATLPPSQIRSQVAVELVDAVFSQLSEVQE
jgi:hypothetical protein